MLSAIKPDFLDNLLLCRAWLYLIFKQPRRFKVSRNLAAPTDGNAPPTAQHRTGKRLAGFAGIFFFEKKQKWAIMVYG